MTRAAQAVRHGRAMLSLDNALDEGELRDFDRRVRELLRGAEINLLVDVRTVPRSRRNAQYNREVLPQALMPFQIGYEHIPSLGGLRGRQTLLTAPFERWPA